MLYACVQRFDVTDNLKKFCKILETKQALRKPAVNMNTASQIIQISFSYRFAIVSKGCL